MPSSFVQDALPVAITGTPGVSYVSLLDVLEKAYGDQLSAISSVNIGYWGADYLANRTDSQTGMKEQPFSYWDPAHPVLTTVVGANVQPSTQASGFMTVSVNSADFANVMIDVGNNIMPNVTIQVPTAQNGDGSTNYQELNVTTIPSQFVQTTALDSALDPAAPFHPPILTGAGGLAFHPSAGAPFQSILSAGFSPSHVPTAADIVASAQHIAALENGVVNVNDCHFIAMDIAAAAGAPLDPNTQTATETDGVVTETPSANEAGGFWRIAFEGSSISPVSDWQTLVKPGDIVRLGWNADYKYDPNGFHTFTVIEGLNADGKHPGEIEVVDNGGVDAAGIPNNTIQEHWVDYNSISNTAEVTIYRLTTDGQYLIDETKDTHADTFLGTVNNDTMIAGNGGDTLLGGDGNDILVGGKGNDTLDGGSGDNTAKFTGNESDYHFTFNADGSVIVADQRTGSPDGTDTLKNIQHLEFADGTFATSLIKTSTEVNGWSIEDGSNTFVGGDGNDTLAGGKGNDTLDGGAGIDKAVFTGNESDYLITFNADGSVTVADQRTGWDTTTTPDGTDTLKNIEQIQFADKTVNVSDLKAYTDADHTSVIVGGSDNYDISAEHGGNVVIVGNGAAHMMYGSSGNDVFYVDNAQQVVYENTGSGDLGGIDEVRTTLASYALPDPNEPGIFNQGKIENLTFVGTGNFNGVGNSLDNVIAGDAGDDTLTGGGGNDTIDGGGGNNTAVYSGNFADYKITVLNGVTTITDLRAGSPDGTDTLENIQHLQFADGIKNFDPLDFTAGSVSINNMSITEGNTGTVLETFTVTRSGGDAAFDVHYATADGTATIADNDYVGQSNTLHFDQGDVSKTISVVVNGDTKVEGDETFNVNLSGATNGATITQAQGVGTIVNDDTASVPQSDTHSTGSVAHPVAHDFNGDGISDVLLGNNNGSLALWELNGNHIDSNTTVGSVPAGWHVDGIGDFGGDGKSDILLHSDSGQVAMWQMDGDHIASNTTVGSIGSDWHVAAVGDFSGDGKADILWQNSQGQVAMWQMNGDHIASNTTVGSIGTDWHVAGTGDFNGDGKADIVWENSTGQVAMWQMNGDHIASNTTVGSIGTDWKAAGVGDFNGDGKADILWQNSQGQVAMWQMNGDHIASNTTVGSAPGWTVAGTGDYNHDGKADVLLQNASGAVAQWQMNGDHIAENVTVGSHSTDWHIT
jgi:Ca2+-binding RTX toxin-like protein